MRPRLPLLLCLLAPALLGGCSAGKTHTTFEGALFPPGVRAHPFALADQHGAPVSLAAYRGQVVLLAFLSTAQRASALVAQQIRGALDELQAHGSLLPATLIVSTDPRRDGPPRARQRFLEDSSLAGRARYLSGPPRTLRALWHIYGVVPASEGEEAFLASTPILLLDRNGFERVGFAVEHITPEALSHDLRLLIAD